MAELEHLIDVYDTGGDAAIAAAVDASDRRSAAYHLKDMAKYYNVALIDVVRKRLALAQGVSASRVLSPDA